jgi:hypothetical protein
LGKYEKQTNKKRTPKEMTLSWKNTEGRFQYNGQPSHTKKEEGQESRINNRI